MDYRVELDLGLGGISPGQMFGMTFWGQVSEADDHGRDKCPALEARQFCLSHIANVDPNVAHTVAFIPWWPPEIFFYPVPSPFPEGRSPP